MAQAHVKLPLLAAALAASCALVTDFDGYELDTSGQCAAPRAICDGECVDLAVDGENCGACAHDCLGTACENGHCAPEKLAGGLGPVSRIAIDETHIYYTIYGDTRCSPPGCTVSRLAKNGGTPQLLTSGVREPTGIALDATHVYVSAYTAGGGAGVRRVPKAGGSDETVDGCNTTFSVGLDDDFVFSVTGSCGGMPLLRRTDKSDFAQQLDVQDDTQYGYSYATYGYMAVGPDDVFWVNKYALMTAPKTLASATELVPAPASGRGIVRDDDGLWVVFGADLYAVSEDGTSSVPFATMQFVDPTMHSVYIGIATDDMNVYWPSDMNGTIVKRAKTPSDAEPVVIASGQFDPFIVAVDATHAYWLNADGSIWRVAL